MCGRFYLASPIENIEKRFSIDKINFSLKPRYNIAPSQQVLAIVNDGQKNLAGYLRWGLVPSWSKDEKMGYKMINARAETLKEKPSFKYPYQKRRCLIVADGFFEWQKTDNNKIPMCIRLKNKEPFAMAGLWERWTSPTGETLHSCTIITTKPNKLMKEIHDRMPVILNNDTEKLWLNRNIEDTFILDEVLQPYPANEMEAFTVSTLVNSPKNDTPEIIVPV